MPVFFLLLLWGQPLAPCAEPLARFAEARPGWSARSADLSWGDYNHEIVRVSRALRTCSEAPAERRAEALAWEAYALSRLGWYAEEAALYDSFFLELAAHAPPARVVWAYRSRAMLHVRKGRPLAALRDYIAATPYAESVATDVRAQLLRDLAVQYYQLGDYDRSLEVAEEAAALLPAPTTDRERRGLAEALGAAVLVHLALLDPSSPDGEHERAALDLIQRAAALLDPARDPRLLAFLRSYEADVYAHRGAANDALRASREALAIARRTDNYLVEVQMLRDVGLRLLAIERPDEALGPLTEALERARGEARWLAKVHLSVGEAHEAANRYAEAEAHYRWAVQAADEERAGLGVTEWAARADADAPHRRLASLLLRTGRAEEAFLQLDATRARYLRDLRQLSRADALPDGARIRLDSLRTLLREAYAEEQEAPTDASTRRAHRLEAEIAEVTGAPMREAPPPLAELQRRAAGRLVVSYFLGDESYAFVLTDSDFHAVPLALSADSIRALVEATGLLAGAADPAAVEAGPLRQLYDVLFRPLEPLLPAGSAVTIIPEGVLAYLPFGMLVTGEAPRFQYHRWPFLVRRHAFSTELAVALLGEPRSAPAPIPLLAFGRSAFGGVLPPSPFPQAALASLPHVPAELAALRRLIPGARLALDAEARPSDLLAWAPEAQVLHIASHAFAHPSHPLYGAVMLAPEADHDGTLFLYDLAGLDLPASLVVLSGCETASGPLQAGEGFRGLQYAFRAAGAHASLAMRWQVDDAATVFLVERFYAHLRRGLAKDVALQRAQLDYLAAHDRLQASPFFWAAADLSGAVEPLDWPRRGLPPVLWLALGLSLLAAAFAAARLARPPSPRHG